MEDAENELPNFFREALATSFGHYQNTRRQLLDLEGVGPINALGLYVAIGDGSAFKNGRAAAACVGVTPKQHSTGGKVKLGTIGKKQGNQRLRYTLFQGTMSVLRQLEKRPPRTEKEKWFWELVQRRGARCAAVAYANKTVRTAWALLHHQTRYQATPLTGQIIDT